jgi:hypothetical protein
MKIPEKWTIMSQIVNVLNIGGSYSSVPVLREA